MKYILRTNPASQEIKRVVIIFPGMDETSKDSIITTNNNLAKYETLTQATAKILEPGTAVITLAYPGPNEWGSPINFQNLTDKIEENLAAATQELNATGYKFNLNSIDLCSHSYGFMPLFWSIEKNIYCKIFKDYEGGTNVHLFEPYGIAAMKSAKENTAAFREHEVLAATQEAYHGIAHEKAPAAAARSELQFLRSFDHHFAVSKINLIFGMFRPTESIHATYGAISSLPETTSTHLSGVGHGGAFVDMLKAKTNGTYLPDYAQTGFITLMTAWICSLEGLDPNDASPKAAQMRQVIEDLVVNNLIAEKLMAPRMPTQEHSNQYPEYRLKS